MFECLAYVSTPAAVHSTLWVQPHTRLSGRTPSLIMVRRSRLKWTIVTLHVLATMNYEQVSRWCIPDCFCSLLHVLGCKVCILFDKRSAASADLALLVWCDLFNQVRRPDCGELIYWMFNSDQIYYYANHLFVNIYAFIQSDIVRAVLFNLILCEPREVRAPRLLVINNYTGWD